MKPCITSEEVQRLDHWLEQARNGCRESLGRALDACRRYLLAVAHREITGELQAKAGALDLVQETFLEAQRDFGQFTGWSQAELLAWLRRLLLNNLEDLKRFYYTDKRHVGRELPLEITSRRRRAKNGLPDPSASQLGEAIRKEQEAELQANLDRLPEKYYQVVTWYFQDHCSYAEIGSRLGVSAEAARKLHHRSVALLRLRPHGLHPRTGHRHRRPNASS